MRGLRFHQMRLKPLTGQIERNTATSRVTSRLARKLRDWKRIQRAYSWTNLVYWVPRFRKFSREHWPLTGNWAGTWVWIDSVCTLHWSEWWGQARNTGSENVRYLLHCGAWSVMSWAWKNDETGTSRTHAHSRFVYIESCSLFWHCTLFSNAALCWIDCFGCCW